MPRTQAELAVDRVLAFREAGHVERCHVQPHFGSYTVGKHTFDMLILLEALHPCPSRELFLAILQHDLGERWTGDVPSFAKRWFPSLKEALEEADDCIAERSHFAPKYRLTEQDRSWLKALDQLEFFLWCDDQIAFGNRHIEPIRHSVHNWFCQHRSAVPEPVQEFVRTYRWKRLQDVPDLRPQELRTQQDGPPRV